MQHPTLNLAVAGEYITLAEASARGYGAQATLRKRISRGTLPAFKPRVGRALYVRVADLDDGQQLVPARANDDVVDRIVATLPHLTDAERARLAAALAA